MRDHYISAFQESLEKQTADTYNAAFDEAYTKYSNEYLYTDAGNEEETPGYFSSFVNWITGPSRGDSFLQ